MATLQYLMLDASYDPIFADDTSLTDLYAVNQAILTRLNLFLGEWWEDLTQGLPVFQTILGKLASSSGLAAMQLAVQQVIVGTPYVTSTSTPAVNFTDGALSITVTVQTAFGTTTVTSTNTPGLSADLDS